MWRTQNAKETCFFPEDAPSQATVHEYSCTPQQTLKMALLVKLNPRLMFGEKKMALHSLVGGSDPSLFKWLPPMVGNDAAKAGIKETVRFIYCLPLGLVSTSPALTQKRRVRTRPPCLVAVN